MMNKGKQVHQEMCQENRTTWTNEEEWIFGKALGVHNEFTEDRWATIAKKLPGKTEKDVAEKYEALLVFSLQVQAGLNSIPNNSSGNVMSGVVGASSPAEMLENKKGESSAPTENNKGVPWTTAEHT